MPCVSLTISAFYLQISAPISVNTSDLFRGNLSTIPPFHLSTSKHFSTFPPKQLFKVVDRLYGIDAGGLDGGVESGEKACEDGEKESQHHTLEGQVKGKIDGFADEGQDQPGQGNAQQGSQGGKQDGFQDKIDKDIPVGGADAFAHPDLGHAFLDRDQQGAEKPDAAHDQRDGGDGDEGDVPFFHEAADLLGDGEHHLADIQEAEVGIHAVAGKQQLARLVLHGGEFLLRARLQVDHVDAFVGSEIVNPIFEGDIHRAEILPAFPVVEVHVVVFVDLVFRQHAHDLEAAVSQLQGLAHRIGGAKMLPGKMVAQHKDREQVVVFIAVVVAPLQQGITFVGKILLVGGPQAHLDVFVAQAQDRAAFDHGIAAFEGQLTLERQIVLIVEAVHALSCPAQGPARSPTPGIHLHLIGGDHHGIVPAHAFHILVDELFEGVNAGEHAHHRQHAYHDAREGEQRAQLVAEDALQRALQGVPGGNPPPQAMVFLHLGHCLYSPRALEYFS